MDRPKIRKTTKPETVIQVAIMDMLRAKGWFVKHTHGNEYQSGFPDLFACQRMYGSRWIEVKNPNGYSFTDAQLRDYPQFSAHGVGIWILTAATEEEYKKLFKPANWFWFLQHLK